MILGESADRGKENGRDILELKLNAILNASHDGLWIIDKDGTVLHVNKAAQIMNNLEESEMVGQNMRDLQRKGVFGKQKLASLEVLEKKRTCTITQDLSNCRKSLVTGSPFFNEKGELILVVVNDRDITHLYDLTAELERNKMILENLSAKNINIGNIDTDLVAESPVMEKIVEKVIQISKFDSTILIQGETGVGKNVVARLIHNYSNRKNKPFISINCSTLPETLIESELFGYECGAFTDARKDGKKGLVEMADEGTLFLDEIGDLPLSAQAKMLRFVENREIIPLGGKLSKKVNVRFITATNKDLKKMVGNGIFRQDLLFRINVISMLIPPLRERKEDIQPLVRFFLERTRLKYQLEKEISVEALELMKHLPYPGNVRELENLVEYLVVTTKDKLIRPSDLPFTLEDLVDGFEGKSLKKAVLHLEFKLIDAALKQYGSQEKAAKILGVNQSTLARKIRKFKNLFASIVHNPTETSVPSH